MMRAGRAAVAAVLMLAVPSAALGQLQHGSIRGIVLGPDGRPADATVFILDTLGHALISIATTGGRFELTGIAPGTYALRAEAPPLRAVVQRLTVAAALPVDVQLQLSAAAAEQIVVSGEQADVTTTNRITLAGETIRRAPTRLRSRALQDAVATTPGWATEDNGILHVRGVDDGFLYVVDGVPVYERIDGLFGMAPDPAMIDTVNVITGYVPPEYGLKSGAVIEVRSATRASDAWTSTVDLAAGSEAMRDVSAITGGPVGRPVALTLGVTGQSSQRFLDPVHPDNLHNEGGSITGGGQLSWMYSEASSLQGVTGFGRSHFDVPHGEEQEEAGQDQRQRTTQHWQTISWQRSWSADAVAQVAGYHRFGSSHLAGGPQDTPLFSSADRTWQRIGLLASVTRQLGRHLVKVGGEAARLRLDETFAFAVTRPGASGDAELSEPVLAFTQQNPFEFRDVARPRLLSAYAQDSFRPFQGLTVDLGLRADWSRLLVAASQWSPRLGAAYRVPRIDATARASFGRFFQPPQAENLLLASSEAARALSPFADGEGGGGSELKPERQTALEAGVERSFGRLVRLDVSWWRRRMRDVADPNVFFGTTIIFPNTVARGGASGIDVRVEVPRRHGLSAFASYSNARVVQVGPINGGLFLEDEYIDIGPGTAFTPDHDQRHVGAAGAAFDHDRTGLAFALNGRYESGTPLEVHEDDFDELRDRPGADLVDFDRGRVKPRRMVDVRATKALLRGRRADVDLRVTILNLTGRRWAFNFGNPFSGTHVGPGRTVQAGVRVAFR